MNVRRFVWVVLLAGLATMAMMAVLQRAIPPQPTRDAPATAPATGPATTLATAPAEGIATRPAAPTLTTAPATTARAPAATRWGNRTFPVHERILGSLLTMPGKDDEDHYLVQVQLTSLGAAVKTLKLADHFATVADKRAHARDPKGYEKTVWDPPAGGKLKGHYSLLNPVGVGEKKDYAFATRQVEFLADGVTLKLAGPRWQAGKVTTDEKGTQSVTFTSTITRNREPFVKIEKTYRLAKGKYNFTVELTMTDLRDRGGPIELKLTQFGPTGVPREDIQSDRRSLLYAKYENGAVDVSKPSISKLKDAITGFDKAGAVPSIRKHPDETVLWIGQANRYFASMVYVLPKDPKLLADPKTHADYAALDESPESKTHLTFLKLGTYRLEQGKPVKVAMDVFAGPKLDSLFEARPLYQKLQYKESVDLGACFCTFAWLTRAMMWLLDLFSKAMLGNYGLAIMLLVVLVRLLLHPLTKKGQLMMARMKKLQPEIAAIREKYANNKAKLNEEMMKVYKNQGASPFLGCLPMMLQMPIWIALWTGLRAAVALRHAPFLPVWITDLAAPDALISFGGKALHLPLVDNMVGPIGSFNLLPILLCVAMMLQQRFNPSTAAAADDQQAKTQKNMMYFMSGFFLLLFYNAPSGLTMYIMTSTFAGLGEQYLIQKHIRQKEQAEAAAETRVVVPGKRFRGQKPKKPKGPFRQFR